MKGDDDFAGGILVGVIIALIVMLITVILVVGAKERYWQHEAIARGYAQWVVDDTNSGHTVFKWKP